MPFAPRASRMVPTTYYGRDSGVGLAVREGQKRGPQRVAVIGLGTGTLAAYGRAGDVYRFYDINPLVEQIAKGSGFGVQPAFAPTALRRVHCSSRTWSASEGGGSGFSFGMVAGSDAHTLRRIGRTWTTAPGRTREEFLASVREGCGLPGGQVGFGPRDLEPAKRAACLAFAVASAPFRFIPWLMAARSKAGEARAVEQLTNYLVERPPSLANPPEGSKIEREPSVPQKEREPFRRASPSGV